MIRIALCLCMLCALPALADDAGSLGSGVPASTSNGTSTKHTADSPDAPMPIEAFENVQGTTEKQEVGFKIRTDAQHEAALSYGMRGGLAWQSYQINQRLKHYENLLSRVYNFRQLLMSAPGGIYVEPPVIEEQDAALKIENQGQNAALTDKVLTISASARLVTTARDWHTYLERTWGTPDPPPNTLLPKTQEERDNWGKWVKEGWGKGIEQANDIFEEDSNRLNRDFVGMVRYRKLLAQAMVSAPFAGLSERGITGGGIEMRIGDRSVTITGPARLRTDSQNWSPINITQPQ